MSLFLAIFFENVISHKNIYVNVKNLLFKLIFLIFLF